MAARPFGSQMESSSSPGLKRFWAGRPVARVADCFHSLPSSTANPRVNPGQIPADSRDSTSTCLLLLSDSDRIPSRSDNARGTGTAMEDTMETATTKTPREPVPLDGGGEQLETRKDQRPRGASSDQRGRHPPTVQHARRGKTAARTGQVPVPCP